MAGDLVYLRASALAQAQHPRTWIRLQLEVAQIRHDDGVHHHRLALGAERYLQAARRAAHRRFEAVALHQEVLQLVLAAAQFDEALWGKRGRLLTCGRCFRRFPSGCCPGRRRNAPLPPASSPARGSSG